MTHPTRWSNHGWDPRGELHALRAELGRLVGSALVGAGGGTPDVELREIDDGWAVIARLPGVAPEEVALELDDRELCIRARSEEEVNADQGMPGTGSRVRGFEYRVTLPAQADAGQIDAVMDHGLLTVTVPRSAQAQRRTITVGRPPYDGGSGGAGRPHPVDPAADREMHQPEVG
ncbi:Hsp20/alpha crystallin family protein [Micromonospora sp. NPDC049559]|uniref:Hsp20/alpha crystallin family protein n=1 Tax=Micromonospora sp. NPDC049559 TaxID=3155923 RepID=UPI0034376A95